METRNIKLTIEKAREWYHSSNFALKDIALQAFTKEELVPYRKIIYLKDACECLGINYRTVLDQLSAISHISNSQAALYELDIIRRALNNNEPVLLRDKIYVPSISITKLHYDYPDVKGSFTFNGLDSNDYFAFYSSDSYCPKNVITSDYFQTEHLNLDLALFGCISEDIANHFGRYFAHLFIEAKYGDMPGFRFIHKYYL